MPVFSHARALQLVDAAFSRGRGSLIPISPALRFARRGSTPQSIGQHRDTPCATLYTIPTMIARRAQRAMPEGCVTAFTGARRISSARYAEVSCRKRGVTAMIAASPTPRAEDAPRTFSARQQRHARAAGQRSCRQRYFAEMDVTYAILFL